MKFFKTNAGTVFSLDPETNELVFKVVRGKARSRLKGMRLKKGEGIAGWVANRGRPRLARDVQKDPLWKREIAKLVRYPTKDILAVPLRDRSGKLVGVLELLNKRDHIGFTRKDMLDLVAISGSVGQLLENARLLAETHRRNQQLKLLNRVGNLVSSSLDPRQVRRRTIDAAIRLLRSEAGSLLLYDREARELYFEVALGASTKWRKSVSRRARASPAGWSSTASRWSSTIASAIRVGAGGWTRNPSSSPGT